MCKYGGPVCKRKGIFGTFALIVLLAALGCITFANRLQAKSDLGPADPGPYKAGWTEVTVTRPGTPATTFPARLVYPATTTGENQPFDGSGGPYPALSFGHAFLSDPDNNLQTLQHLATHGYIVIAARSYTSFSIDHAAFAADLRHSLTYLEQKNQDSSSPYYHRINTNAFGIFGYSIGGGASILAAADDARIKVVANMAAAETTPSAAEAAARLFVPMRMLAGSQDQIAPVADHQQPIYNQARPPKQLAVLQGGSHCGFSDPGLFCFDQGSMSQDTQLFLTRYWLTVWFDYYLKGDSSLESVVWGSGLHADPLVVVQAERYIEGLDEKQFLPLVSRP